MDSQAKFVFHLLMVFLALSKLVRVDAAPVTTGTGSLMVHESRVAQHVSSGASAVASERANSGAEAISGRRMDIEVNDYPGSGANNRHTPRPQFGRGCIDC